MLDSAKVISDCSSAANHLGGVSNQLQSAHHKFCEDVDLNFTVPLSAMSVLLITISESKRSCFDDLLLKVKLWPEHAASSKLFNTIMSRHDLLQDKSPLI